MATERQGVENQHHTVTTYAQIPLQCLYQRHTKLHDITLTLQGSGDSLTLQGSGDSLTLQGAGGSLTLQGVVSHCRYHGAYLQRDGGRAGGSLILQGAGGCRTLQRAVSLCRGRSTLDQGAYLCETGGGSGDTQSGF